MASPSSNETFVIIRQDKHGRPHEIIRHNTDEGAHVASAIRICREVLKNPKVKTVFEGIVEDLEAPSELWYKDKAKDKVVDLFIDKIMQHFPYVFVDPSLTNPAVRGCHWRHVGAEGYDFDPHKQSIVINGVVLEKACLAGKIAQGIKDPDSKEQKRCRVFLFHLATTFLHELGHVFITFLGGGKVVTPVYIDLQVPESSVGSSATAGEAGAYVEYMTFGGQVIRIRDPAQDDDQPGLPYLVHEEEYTEILQETVDEFVKCKFTFPFINLGAPLSPGMQIWGEGLPMVKSKGDPLFMADTQKLLAEYAANQDRSDEFERALDDLVRDNPNPKTSSAQ